MSESKARDKFLRSLKKHDKPYDDNNWDERWKQYNKDDFSNNAEIFKNKSGNNTGKITDIKDYLESDPDYRKRQQIKRPHTKKKKSFKGKIVSLLLSGAIAVGGFAIGTSIYNGIKNQNQRISTVQAINLLGETPQSLGIKNETYNEIQNIKNLLENGKLSDDKIIQMAPRICSLCIDSTTSKIANALGESEESISFEHEYVGEGTTVQTVTVNSNHQRKSYRSKDFLTFNNSISNEIATSIKNIDRMHKIMGKIQSGDYKTESLLKEYKDIVNSIDEFAASKVKIDDNGNIYVDSIRNKDIDDVVKAKGYIQETRQQIEEKFNDSGDVYSANANGDVSKNTDTINLEYDDDGR